MFSFYLWACTRYTIKRLMIVTRYCQSLWDLFKTSYCICNMQFLVYIFFNSFKRKIKFCWWANLCYHLMPNCKNLKCKIFNFFDERIWLKYTKTVLLWQWRMCYWLLYISVCYNASIEYLNSCKLKRDWNVAFQVPFFIKY